MKHIHLIGIGGSGLSAIALFLKEQGYVVTGSDRSLSPAARQLADKGVGIFAGHAASHIAGADLVIRSAAVPEDNPEVQAAIAAGIPVVKRQDFLDELLAGRFVIAVAGTHGKTTTTAMLAWTLSQLGHDPAFIIGGVAKNFGVNAHAGTGRYFVIEADEYDHMFLGLSPTMIVVTNVEHDHPDCFPTPGAYLDAFRRFVQRLPSGGELIISADDPGAQRLTALCKGADFQTYTFGLGESANFRAVDLKVNTKGGFDFKAVYGGPGRADQQGIDVSLSVPGTHNVLNALAALTMIFRRGLPLAEAAAALGSFSGTGRRFDVLGEAGGITIIDDYAHHPTEINATLAAARARYPGQRIWAVWQPHTYSRTITLMDAFTQAFKQADRVVVTEVYAAREFDDQFSTAQLVAKLNHAAAQFCATLQEATNTLLKNLKPGDVVLVLSAGDADQISAQVLMGLREKEKENA